MTMQSFHIPNETGMGLFAMFAGLLGVATTIFWMVVAWRAMRAHERIADTLEGSPERLR